MAEELKERVGTLEVVLGEFIVQTNKSLNRLEKEMKDFKDEMKDFKDETSVFREEIERQRKESNKKWGELANKMGTLVEDIVAPNMPRIAREHFDMEMPWYFSRYSYVPHPQNPKKQREFDVIIADSHRVIINETKSTPRLEYAQEFVQDLAEIPSYFPAYADREFIFVFASLSIPENVVKYLTRHNVYAMVMGDENMELLNYEAIRAKKTRKKKQIIIRITASPNFMKTISHPL